VIFDIVVIGAGPAGCAAAIGAGNRGLRVGLIEKAAFPRDVPGEALHPDVNDLLATLGVADQVANAGFIRCPGWIHVRSGERAFIPFADSSGLRFGYQAWRSEFDVILLEQARSLGVTIVQPATSGELLLEKDRVIGLQVNGEPWVCSYLVDASGSAGWLGRRLRLPVQDVSPRLIARFAYFKDHNVLGSLPEFREHACGWTWLARVKGDWCQCVQVSLSSPGVDQPLPDDLPPDVRCRGANATWRFTPQCAGPGYFICGESAAALDPAASSGVARAMASGMKAADLAAAVASNRMHSQTAAASYCRWYADLFLEHARKLASQYAQLENAPEWLWGLETRFGEIEQRLPNSLANAANAVIT